MALLRARLVRKLTYVMAGGVGAADVPAIIQAHDRASVRSDALKVCDQRDLRVAEHVRIDQRAVTPEEAMAIVFVVTLRDPPKKEKEKASGGRKRTRKHKQRRKEAAEPPGAGVLDEGSGSQDGDYLGKYEESLPTRPAPPEELVPTAKRDPHVLYVDAPFTDVVGCTVAALVHTTTVCVEVVTLPDEESPPEDAAAEEGGTEEEGRVPGSEEEDGFVVVRDAPQIPP